MNQKLKRFSKSDFDFMLEEAKLFLMRTERGLKAKNLSETLCLQKYSHGAISKFIVECEESRKSNWISFKRIKTEPHGYLKGVLISEKRIRTLDNIL